MEPSITNVKSEIKKKPVKKSIPFVRQTLTSYKRLLKANPLLKYEAQGIDIQQLLASKSSTTSASNSKTEHLSTAQSESKSHTEFRKPARPLQRSQSVKVHPVSTISGLTGVKKDNLISGNRFGAALTNTNFMNKKPHPPLDISKQSNDDFNTPRTELMSSTKLDIHGNDKKKVTIGKRLNKPKIELTASRNIKAESKIVSTNIKPDSTTRETEPVSVMQKKKKGLTVNKPIRRSLSTGHLNSKKGHTFDPSVAYTKQIILNSPRSLEELSTIEDANLRSPFSPILEESRSRDPSYVFRTPSAYERRSVSHFGTPKSLAHKGAFRSSTPAPMVLQQRLNEWLKKRGKSLSTFHHLKCFGLTHQPVNEPPSEDEENKENIDVEDRSSYDDLRIVAVDKSKETKQNNDEPILKTEEIEKVSKEALLELQKLVKEGYPRGQCECWLNLIKDKYQNVEEEPEFWECRATIEQSVGNIQSAVECYKTAIIQGAEVKTVDQSLDNLLQKFSLLNINTNNNEEKSKTDKERERIMRDARNVFKSSIIQFAVQERKLKRKNKSGTSSEDKVQVIATPVRRSTRLSRSAYTSTPGVKICSSIKELDADVNFERNKALC